METLFPGEYTAGEAVAYLKQERKIDVSRQAIHLFVIRNRDRCTARGKAKGRDVKFWTIPQAVLDEYFPTSGNRKK